MEDRRMPLDILNEFLFSDSRLEPRFYDRVFVIWLKVAILAAMVAGFLAIFFAGSFAVSWLMVHVLGLL